MLTWLRIRICADNLNCTFTKRSYWFTTSLTNIVYIYWLAKQVLLSITFSARRSAYKLPTLHLNLIHAVYCTPLIPITILRSLCSKMSELQPHFKMQWKNDEIFQHMHTSKRPPLNLYWHGKKSSWRRHACIKHTHVAVWRVYFSTSLTFSMWAKALTRVDLLRGTRVWCVAEYLIHVRKTRKRRFCMFHMKSLRWFSVKLLRTNM